MDKRFLYYAPVLALVGVGLVFLGLEFALLIGGLIGLVLAARVFLTGAVGVSHEFGIPEFVVGSIIVAIGTSAPELAINIAASLREAGDVIASNIIGSNIVNIGLGIGLAGLLVAYKQPSQKYVIAALIGLFGVLALMAVTLFLGASPATALFPRWAAILFMVVFVAFTAWTLMFPDQEEEEEDDEDAIDPKTFPLAVTILMLIGGVLGMTFCADLAVQNAVGLAEALGVPSVVIGATIVAAGGSLPEVFSCLEAARRKKPNIVVGNIVGSQVFNIFGILGASGLVAPFLYTRGVSIDLIFLGAMTVLWIWSFYNDAARRIVGPLMIGGFVAYMLYLVALALNS